MSNFTKGKWEYAEYVPEGVTINSKEYIIFTGSVNPDDDGDDIALARREADARLIAAVPDMYVFLNECVNSMPPDIRRRLKKKALHILARIDSNIQEG